MKRLLVALVLAAVAHGAFADRFFYAYSPGDRFRVISTVDEKVYVNRKLSHVASIINRIAFTVLETRPDGSSRLQGTFQTMTSVDSGSVKTLESSYESEYWISRLGVFSIEPRYFMPVVRSVPTFPDREIYPGDTWTAPGEERHDFREDFGIPEPYVIPFVASYKYLGPREWKGVAYPSFSVEYTIFYRPGVPRKWKGTYPVQIAGFSKQVVYWDTTIGHPIAYEEEFRFVFDLANGMVFEYAGTASAEVVEAVPMDRKSTLEEVEKAVGDLAGVEVREDPKGITISLQNIQFEPDSAVLRDSEKAKLDVIAELLLKYPDRDILISGHTALAGTEAGRAALSLARAQAVADYLVSKGVDASRIIVQGFGATVPIADNSTAEGMAKNRRVEITILEN